MSAFSYYKSRGYTPLAPLRREISNAAVASTITFYTPTSGRRLAITNLTIMIAGGLAGTIRFYFGGDNDGQVIATYGLASSVSLSPVISSWESTAANAPLLIRVSTGETNGWEVSAEAFELI